MLRENAKVFRFLGKYGVTKEDIKEIGKLWQRQKYRVFRFWFGYRTTLVFDVNEFDNRLYSHYVNEFREKFGVNLANFSLQEVKDNRLKDGQKLGKYLLKLVAEDKKEDFKRLWQRFREEVFLVGKLVVTISPLEFLFISDGGSWKTCHSFGHDRCLANFGYAVDFSTILVYFVKNFDEFDDETGLPKKLWRQLVYFDVEDETLTFSRQYPSENETLARLARETLRKLFFGKDAKVKVFRALSYTVYEPEVDDVKFMPYVDEYSFLTMARDVFDNVFINLQNNIETTYFYGNFVARLVDCSLCHNEIPEEDAIVDEDGNVFCPYCWENSQVCCLCGRRDLSEYMIEDETGNVVCETCYDNVEPVTCQLCGRETYLPVLVHEKILCEACGETYSNFLYHNFDVLPFYKDEFAQRWLKQDLTRPVYVNLL